MDDQDLTPWEEINPSRAVSVPPRAPPCGSLEPATDNEFRNELTACLALVAPVGMTEEARADWLMVAWETLKHLPADILHYGAVKARKSADHHSKIVPIIVAETEDWMETRRAIAPPPATRLPPERRIEGPRTCTPEEAREILEQYGLASHSPIARPVSGNVEPQRKPEATHRRKPTRADYIALGVDPSILDQMGENF